jgi:hypothetical protein
MPTAIAVVPNRKFLNILSPSSSIRPAVAIRRTADLRATRQNTVSRWHSLLLTAGLDALYERFIVILPRPLTNIDHRPLHLCLSSEPDLEECRLLWYHSPMLRLKAVPFQNNFRMPANHLTGIPSTRISIFFYNNSIVDKYIW